MQVTRFLVTQKGNYTTFSADFIFSKPIGGRKEKILYWIHWLFQVIQNPVFVKNNRLQVRRQIWYRLLTKDANQSNVHDTFFLLALPLAIATGEDLYFDGTVSPYILKKVLPIQNFYQEIKKREIRVNAKAFVDKKLELKQKQTGQFFTLGVDSFYTLRRAKKQKGFALIYVDGYDIPFYEKKFLHSVHQNIRNVAKQISGRAQFVETNLRELSDGIIGWGRYHVTALAAVAQLLSLKKIYISGESFEASDWGLRLGVDKLYSTQRTGFTLVGHQVLRIEKIRSILRSDLKNTFLRNVRVCWENVREKNIAYNCSQCQKCIKTQLCLLAEKIQKTPTFQSIKTEDLEKITLNIHTYDEWDKLLISLKKAKVDKEILAAVVKLLKKPMAS